MESNPKVEVKAVSKQYLLGKALIPALNGIIFAILSTSE